jgi:hypothetical protein
MIKHAGPDGSDVLAIEDAASVAAVRWQSDNQGAAAADAVPLALGAGPLGAFMPHLAVETINRFNQEPFLPVEPGGRSTGEAMHGRV